MHQYIRTQVIKAEPMTYRQAYENGLIPENSYVNEYDEALGYLLVHMDGFKNWKPKEVFDQEYEAVERMTFGLAIKALKAGHKVARKGWTLNSNRPPIIPPAPIYIPTNRVEYVSEYDLTYILLSDGNVAVCDGSQYELVRQHKWTSCKGKYAMFTDNSSDPRKTVKLHNYIMPPMDGYMIDHINGNGLDCRSVNMRYASCKENCRNKSSQCNSTSCYLGVSIDRSRNLWIASIQVDGQTKHLGRYDDEVEAAIAYDKAALEHYGKFARLNFPNINSDGAQPFLWLKPATTVKAEWCKDLMLKRLAEANGGEIEALGTICMFTAQKQILSGWLASQTDMLSEDWEIVTE